MPMDPVCHMDVEPETAAAQTEYEGETYYFCAPGCKAAFDKNPEKYAESSKEREGEHQDDH